MTWNGPMLVDVVPSRSYWSSVGDTVALAVRRLRQDQIAAELRSEPTTADVAWLDADLG